MEIFYFKVHCHPVTEAVTVDFFTNHGSHKSTNKRIKKQEKHSCFVKKAIKETFKSGNGEISFLQCSFHFTPNSNCPSNDSGTQIGSNVFKGQNHVREKNCNHPRCNTITSIDVAIAWLLLNSILVFNPT